MQTMLRCRSNTNIGSRFLCRLRALQQDFDRSKMETQKHDDDDDDGSIEQYRQPSISPPETQHLMSMMKSIHRGDVGRVSLVTVSSASSKLMSRLSWDDLEAMRSKTVLQQSMEQRMIYFDQELSSIIQICLFRRKERLVMRLLKRYSVPLLIREQELLRMRWRNACTTKPYNDVIWFASHKRNRTEMIELVLEHMKLANIAPDLSTYVGALVGYGYQNKINQARVQGLVDEMTSMGMTVSEIESCPSLSNEARKYLKKALDIIASVNPAWKMSTSKYQREESEDMEHLREQLRMESHGTVSIASIDSTNHARPVLGRCRRDTKSKSGLEAQMKMLDSCFRSQLTAAILNKKEVIKTKRDDMDLGKILDVFTPLEFVDLMMQAFHDVLLQSKSYNPLTGSLSYEIGTHVMQKFVVAYKTRLSGTESRLNSPQKDNQVNKEDNSVDSLWDLSSLVSAEVEWPFGFRVRIGKLFVDIMVNNMNFKPSSSSISAVESFDASDVGASDATSSKSTLPALYKIVEAHGSYFKTQIKVHPEVVEVYHCCSEGKPIKLNASLLPTVIPPLPWISENTGGFALCQVPFVRTSHRRSGASLSTVMEAVNVISRVPWKINKRVLDVAADIFRRGGNDDIGIPVEPPRNLVLPSIERGCSEKERRHSLNIRKYARKAHAEAYSLWCNERYRLSVANKFRDRIFWFPHNLDFRGRAYAVSPHFSHLGSDVSRALLLFGRGKPLGAVGLDWLKIHLVNLTEMKKSSSITERLAFADEIIDEIVDSAERPLEGRKWWMQSENPWQTLACAIEITDALNSGRPDQYFSHHPVHQDGSCNVLQHYAALGRDDAGARMVNLVSGTHPNDVYSAVASLVDQLREKDEQNGLGIAVMLKGMVSRKVIKQTVMTTVYGVTLYGARNQISKRLAEKDFSSTHIKEASNYLSEKTFLSIRQMFSSAREIQDWLTDSAKLMCHITGQPLSWTTPLGFYVSQPYFKERKLKNPKITLQVPDSRKQSTAIPPNFVHSLDSTHMMMTALECRRNNLDFASVHDSYWTHPCDVPVMNQICREQFVKLHSSHLLKRFSEDCMQACASSIVWNGNMNEHQKNALWMLREKLEHPPETGKFNLDLVLNSTYFFS